MMLDCNRHSLTLKSLATAIPRAAEMEVELWPAPKGSYSLSDRFVNPDMPPVCLMVGMRDLLPVRILWGYACSTEGGLAWRALAGSTTRGGGGVGGVHDR